MDILLQTCVDYNNLMFWAVSAFLYDDRARFDSEAEECENYLSNNAKKTFLDLQKIQFTWEAELTVTVAAVLKQAAKQGLLNRNH